MATSDQSKYSTDVKQDTRSACCSPCSDEGNNITARHYCVDCELYFCGKCVKVHNKISALKAHHVNDIDTSMSSNEGDTTTEGHVATEVTIGETQPRCPIHQDKLIDTFCPDHGEVCCKSCAVVKHRLCSTKAIDEASKDFQSNPDLNKCKGALTQVLIQLKEVKEKRTANIDRVGKQKLELIASVDEYEETVIARVKELANISRKEIRSEYEEHKTALDNDVVAIDVSITTSTDYANKVGQTGNERLLFTAVHTAWTVVSDAEILLKAMSKEMKEREIHFHIDKTLENTASEMKSLGNIGTMDDECAVKEYQATFQKNVRIKQSNYFEVYDMCLMDSGELILADNKNGKLKRYSSELQYKDEIQLSGHPVAICKLDKHEVAVRMTMIFKNTVEIISVGQSMQCISSFNLADYGFGMTYDSGTEEIFACEGRKLSVYSKTWNKLRTYDKDANGEAIFTNCRQITLSENGNDLYVTDGTRGVVVLDKQGHLKMKVPLQGINDTWPLCLLPGDIVLTGSRGAGKIVQVDKDGKLIGTLIDTNDGRRYTYCVVYDRQHSRLFVGGASSVSVYTISAR